MGNSSCGIYALCVVVDDEVFCHHKATDAVVPRRVVIALDKVAANNREIDKQAIVLLFPCFVLLENLPAHVLTDPLSALDSLLVSAAHGLITYDVVALDDGGVRASAELQRRDGHEGEYYV